MKAARSCQNPIQSRELQREADKTLARLEDCIYAIEKVKTTKKGIWFHRYGMATWREAAALAIKI